MKFIPEVKQELQQKLFNEVGRAMFERSITQLTQMRPQQFGFIIDKIQFPVRLTRRKIVRFVDAWVSQTRRYRCLEQNPNKVGSKSAEHARNGRRIFWVIREDVKKIENPYVTGDSDIDYENKYEVTSSSYVDGVEIVDGKAVKYNRR